MAPTQTLSRSHSGNWPGEKSPHRQHWCFSPCPVVHSWSHSCSRIANMIVREVLSTVFCHIFFSFITLAPGSHPLCFTLGSSPSIFPAPSLCAVGWADALLMWKGTPITFFSSSQKILQVLGFTHCQYHYVVSVFFTCSNPM